MSKTLWCRAGFTLNVTDEDYAVLIGDDYEKACELLTKIIRDPQKARLDGETYFPESAQYDEVDEISELEFDLSE